MFSKINSIVSKIFPQEDSIKTRLLEVGKRAREFNNIPANVRERQLKEYASDRNPQIRTLACDVLRHNFDLVSENTRNKLLANLGTDDEMPAGRTYVSGILQVNFEKISKDVRENLLLKFSGDKMIGARYDCGTSVFQHFSDISDNVRDEIITKLSSDPGLQAYPL